MNKKEFQKKAYKAIENDNSFIQSPGEFSYSKLSEIVFNEFTMEEYNAINVDEWFDDFYDELCEKACYYCGNIKDDHYVSDKDEVICYDCGDELKSAAEYEETERSLMYWGL